MLREKNVPLSRILRMQCTNLLFLKNAYAFNLTKFFFLQYIIS